MCVFVCVLLWFILPYRVTLQEWNQLDDVVAKWEEQGESDDLLVMVKEVYHYVDWHREIGASVKDLKVRTVNCLFF